MRAPVPAAPAGEAVEVLVSVDRRQISAVRLYFKPMKATSYVYLEMAPSGEDRFTAQLPPARNDTKGLDYLLLFHNERGECRKTKPFRLLIQNSYRTAPPAVEPVEVFWEPEGIPRLDNVFAVPFKFLASSEPFLAVAKEDAYPPINPETASAALLAPISAPGGFFFSIKIGGFGLFYGVR